VRQLGTRGAVFTPYQAGDAAFTARLADVLAASDDELLAAYVNDEAALTYRRLRGELAAQTRRALVHPVFFGSAMTGAGVDALTAGIRELLPAAQGDADGPVSGTVFKVERGPAGEKIAFARLFSGTVHARDRLRFGPERAGGGRGQRVTAISVFDRGSAVPSASVVAGQIGKLWGLSDVQIGDTLGVGPAATPARRQFAPPTLETVVVPCRPADRGALHVALAQLAEQDPLINLRRDDERQEILVSLYGEVQKEVVQATLADDFGIDVGFRRTTTICIERPAGSGSAVEMIGVEPNPFLAGIGLRVDPGAVGSGVEFRLEIELGALPFSFLKAVEEIAREALGQGIYGWQVTDCVVTMTHSGYWPRQSHAHGTFDKSMSSTAGDFRNLTPLVLMTALARAGTRVYEPWHRFRLEAPADALTPLLALLARLHGVPRAHALQASSCVLDGEIPAARVRELEEQLPALTRGEGVLETAFERYQPVRGVVPARPRSDHNPLDRKEYLLHVARRVPGRQPADALAGRLRSPRGLILALAPGPAPDDPAPVRRPRPPAARAAEQLAEPAGDPACLPDRAAAHAVIPWRDPYPTGPVRPPHGGPREYRHRPGRGTAQLVPDVEDGREDEACRHADDDRGQGTQLRLRWRNVSSPYSPGQRRVTAPKRAARYEFDAGLTADALLRAGLCCPQAAIPGETAMTITPPTSEDLAKIAERYRFGLSPEDVESFRVIIAGAMASYEAVERLYAARLPGMPDRLHQRPAEAENELGAWYVTTEIKGRRRPAGRAPGSDQGQHRGGRGADDERVGDRRGVRAAPGCHGGDAPARRGSDDHRQGGVRGPVLLGRQSHLKDRPGPQSLGPDEIGGRLVKRQRGAGRRRLGRLGARRRSGRLDPDPQRVLRHRRAQADPRAGAVHGGVPDREHPRSPGTDHPHGG
jgi:ribosomal protection tetracycline resistance protein